MKLYSFSFGIGMIAEYQKLIPTTKNKKVFRDFLFNHYTLPNSLEKLQEPVTEYEVYPLRMNDKEIEKIDLLISQANSNGVKITRSALLRDIYQELINLYRNNPISISEQKRQTFKVPVGTKERIAKLIEDGNRTYELSSFIMDGYIPSNEFPSLRGQEQEGFDFKTDIEVFENLDEISEEYNFKKGGRAKIFRDALNQFEKILHDNPPKKAVLNHKLQMVIEDYKTIEKPEIIKEKINDYLREE